MFMAWPIPVGTAVAAAADRDRLRPGEPAPRADAGAGVGVSMKTLQASNDRAVPGRRTSCLIQRASYTLGVIMTWIALKMLTGDRAKYLGIIAGVTFAALLIAQQASIGCGLLLRTTSTIQDIADVDIWVMDHDVRVHRRTEAADRRRPLPRAGRARRGLGRAVLQGAGPRQARRRQPQRAPASTSRSSCSAWTTPPWSGRRARWSLGTLADLRIPDAVIMDENGYQVPLAEGTAAHAGKVFEMNDHRAVIVGICKASDTFQTFPILYTRYSQAVQFIPQARQVMSAVFVHPQPGVDPHAVCRRIEEQTRTRSDRPGDGRPRLKALTREEFMWLTLRLLHAPHRHHRQLLHHRRRSASSSAAPSPARRSTRSRWRT